MKEVDYDFLACRIMKEFGWTIEYTLSLSYPVFCSLFELIKQVRYDSAIDEFYTPYAAAKYGGKCHKFLFDGRGDFFVNEKKDKKSNCSDEEITAEMIERANIRLKEELAKHNRRLAESAGA